MRIVRWSAGFIPWRHVRDDGSEFFSRLEGHPQSAGEVTDKGTIAEFLQAQGAAPSWRRPTIISAGSAAAARAIRALTFHWSNPKRRPRTLTLRPISSTWTRPLPATGGGRTWSARNGRPQVSASAILYGQIEEARGGPHDER